MPHSILASTLGKYFPTSITFKYSGFIKKNKERREYLQTDNKKIHILIQNTVVPYWTHSFGVLHKGQLFSDSRGRLSLRFERGYAALCIGIFAAFSIFSINIPYPVVGSFIRTCVTAPTSLPFWMMGEPDTSVVNKGQHFLTKNSQKVPRATKRSLSAVMLFKLIFNIILWLEFC